MKNFGRTLRIALDYRWTLISSFVCAIIVAVFWAGNLTALIPIVEVSIRGDSLQNWVQGEIDEAEELCAQKQAEIDRLELLAAESDHPTKHVELHKAQERLAAEQKALSHYKQIQPWLIRYMPSDPLQTIIVIVALFLAGTLAKNVFLFVHSMLVSRIANLSTLRLRQDFYRRTLKMDISTFSTDGCSDLMSRFTHDTEFVAAGTKILLGKAVREPLKAIACLAGAAFICWRLLLFSMIIAPLAALSISYLARALKRANRRAMEEMAQIYGLLAETLQGIKIVKAFTMERQERRRFHKSSKAYYRKAMRIAVVDAISKPTTEIIGLVMVSLALIAGAHLVLGRQTHLLGIKMCASPLNEYAMMMFFGFLAGASDPARKLTETFNRIQRASAAADRIYEMLDRQPSVRNPLESARLGRHRVQLSFDQVSFRYRPEIQVLKDISLDIPYGETLALVGPNGSGKSTLANMVPRFFDPTHGRVLIDGVDLKEARLNELRGQIGMVTQEALLFDDTVYNNIRYGSPHATKEQVIDAAKRAHAHRLIQQRLSQGYETVVGPGGNLLSGGQRQRIALARAILRDPAILILDEATSQIDLESEQAIHEALKHFTRDRTTLIITHRLSTLALADRILVLDEGRAVDLGTHDELMRRCPLYSRLHEIQFREIA